jgi:ATP-binding cassette subfamily F protein 3
MPLAALSHVSMHFGGPLLLDDVTVAVEPGARVGVIGPNGSGKSTLLRLLAGRLDPVSGQVIVARGATAAYQAQEMEHVPGATVLQEACAVFSDVHARERRLHALSESIALARDEDERRRLLADYERLRTEHEGQGVHDVERHVRSVLGSLGFRDEAIDGPVERLSGGERNVLGLARVLLTEPDLVLLDEPTNHMDVEAVEWFVEFARRMRAAIVMVSHDRHVLDALAREIWEVGGGRVTPWTGNWSAYRESKARADALQERQWRAQQRAVERLRTQARRLKDMANAYDDPGQAKRAKAMERRAERMETVERPDAGPRRLRAALAAGERHGRIALTVRDFTFGYGDRLLFEHASLELEQGDRVCLVGPNGSGKSTLFRKILEEGGWENETLRLGRSVKAGEYRQLHDFMDPGTTLQDWVMERTALGKTASGELLHRFLFRHEDLSRAVATLSGGEKSRLQLARLVHERVNFLLLDEPTNHLDIPTCEQLEEMLRSFDGTLLMISHDRFFLERLVDRVVEVADRTLVDHRCTFAEWWEGKRERARRRRSALEGEIEAQADVDGRTAHEERRARLRERNALRRRVERLETRIAELEARQADLESRLAGAWSGGERTSEAVRLGEDFAAVRAELGTLYAEWATLADSAEGDGG